LERLTPTKGPDTTTYAERQARALADALCGAPGSGATAPPVKAVVHCDLGLLTGASVGHEVADIEGVGPVTVEVLRRLLCDARIALHARTPDGCGTELARVRQPPAPLERAVRRRDGTCRFPDCSGRHDLVTHHIVHWADGGPTELENLVTLCAAHHHAHHDRGWAITGDPNATLTFTSPTGQRFGTRPVPGWKPPTRSRTTPRRE
jgi:5-methylcytosine-specific restriction endonuclease McrA